MPPSSENEDPETERSASPADDKKEKTRAAATSSKQSAKRRTKTGCLTCRKRRIKCGEEKPFCKNCVKSKRECAGYVQPLVYKQHNQGPYPTGHDGAEPGSLGEDDHFQFNAFPDVHYGQPNFYNPFTFSGYGDGLHQRNAPLSVSTGFHYPPPDASTPFVPQAPLPPGELYRRHSMHQIPGQHPHEVSEFQIGLLRDGPPWSGRSQQSSISDSAPFSYVDTPSTLTSPYDVYPGPLSAGPGYFPYDPTPIHDIQPRRYSVHGFVQRTPFESVVPTLANPQIPLLDVTGDHDYSDDYADMKMEDVSDSEEFAIQREQHFAELLGKYKGLVKNELQSQRIVTSRALYSTAHNVSVSPLQDERNERIFCHFVEVTGRCMNIFERQPPDSWSLPPRTLWSYTLPAAAIHHPALAHAMLALGGLHAAKLQHTSEDPSLKHFTYALRRVSNLLSLPKRRHEITTLATVLLLGFYEVLAADHSRWNLHLSGATRLVMEHDFARLTRNVRVMRSRAKSNIFNFSRISKLTEENYVAVGGIPESLLDDEEWEVDQNVVSALTGKKVDFDNQVQPGFSEGAAMHSLTEKDVSELKIKMDLRWWYCKQDVFQSMISGDQLLMDYDHWIYCPPRGRIGNASQPHATFDHLVLLLARLTNFGGQDRVRKQQVVTLQGGQWRPPPGLFPSGPPSASTQTPKADQVRSTGIDESSANKIMPGTGNNEESPKPKPPQTPSANEGRVRQNKSRAPKSSTPSAEPSFYGTMPPPPVPPKMSSSFHAMSEQLHKSAHQGHQAKDQSGIAGKTDLKGETEAALAEHAAIGSAFDLFASSLGPEFQPLANDGSQTQSSPFGPLLRYRSVAIATIWLHFYVGKVLWHRLHPHMPPAAMVSAAVTAHLTKDFAHTAGKVAAGLYSMAPGSPGDVLDPLHAAALIESTFPLLFAAIQYQDASQRGWIISKLHDIARMTGWQTSGAVAAACEIAWERMGLAGKGPPYVRSLDRDNKDARVNGTSRKVGGRGANVPTNLQDLPDEAESQVFSHDRSLIGKHRQTRVHWALGILSVEEDIKKLDISK